MIKTCFEDDSSCMERMSVQTHSKDLLPYTFGRNVSGLGLGLERLAQASYNFSLLEHMIITIITTTLY